MSEEILISNTPPTIFTVAAAQTIATTTSRSERNGTYHPAGCDTASGATRNETDNYRSNKQGYHHRVKVTTMVMIHQIQKAIPFELNCRSQQMSREQ